MNVKVFVEERRKDIEYLKFKRCFGELLVFTKVINDPLYDEVLLLNVRYKENGRDKEKGMLDQETYSRTQTNIVNSLLALLNRIEESVEENSVEIENRQRVQSQTNVFISYSSESRRDWQIATSINRMLSRNTHKVFFYDQTIPIGSDWPKRLERDLLSCDYFILILSQTSMLSDMVIEELRRVFEDTEKQPKIITIRVELPLSYELPYQLSYYLQKSSQFYWKSDEDNETLTLFLQKFTREKVWYQSKVVPLQKTSLAPRLPLGSASLSTNTSFINSIYYIEREADKKCHKVIRKNYAVLRIKAPRQFGKTALLSRLIRTAKELTYSVIVIDFQLFSKADLNDLDQLLQLICAKASEQLHLEDRISEYWESKRRPKLDKCYNYFNDYLLKERQKPILFIIDKADKLFRHQDNTIDFFGMLRSWHEMAKNSASPKWKHFSMVITYSTDDIPIEDLNTSFFNVGDVVELRGFEAKQVRSLAEAYRLDWELDISQSLQKFLGGHPYLINKALYELTERNISLDQLRKEAILDNGPFGDHLKRHFFSLGRTENGERLETLREIIQERPSSNIQECLYLQSVGLIKPAKDREGYELTSDLYLAYFKEKLLERGAHNTRPSFFRKILLYLKTFLLNSIKIKS